jgi:hypothetical protein
MEPAAPPGRSHWRGIPSTWVFAVNRYVYISLATGYSILCDQTATDYVTLCFRLSSRKHVSQSPESITYSKKNGPGWTSSGRNLELALHRPERAGLVDTESVSEQGIMTVKV